MCKVYTFLIYGKENDCGSSDGAEGRDRTGTNLSAHWILSPARLPIPPLRHAKNNTINRNYNQEFVILKFLYIFYKNIFN